LILGGGAGGGNLPEGGSPCKKGRATHRSTLPTQRNWLRARLASNPKLGLRVVTRNSAIAVARRVPAVRFDAKRSENAKRSQLNSHGLAPTRLRDVRVYQFHHAGDP